MAPRATPDLSAVRSIYWMVTLGVTVLTCLYVSAQSREIYSILWVLALGMPAIQLGGSLLSVFIIGGIPGLNRDRTVWKRLGWITLGTVIGGVAGIAFMYIYMIS